LIAMVQKSSSISFKILNLIIFMVRGTEKSLKMPNYAN
jgi:hypothetical protein